MILLLALGAGLLVGLGRARLRGSTYQPPNLRHLWLVPLAFLLQFITAYLPAIRGEYADDRLAAAGIVTSQAVLLGFVWLNRRLPGMPVLITGSVLNLAVIAANGGFMPISPRTAS